MRNLIAHVEKKLAEEIAAYFGHGLRKDGKRSGDAAQGIHFGSGWPSQVSSCSRQPRRSLGDKLFTFTRLPVAHPRRHPHHFNERQLRHVLSRYFQYQHRARTHLSLDKDCPQPRPIQPLSAGEIITSQRWAVCIIGTNVAPPDFRGQRNDAPVSA